MSDFDDHVISYEEAVRRRRAREAQKESAAGELKISDAMSHLLEEAGAQDSGDIPAHLRDIVEREFTDGEPPPDRPPTGRPGGDA
jgi:hypothetical protein